LYVLDPGRVRNKIARKIAARFIKASKREAASIFSQRANQERVRRLTENNLERRQSFSAVGKSEY